MIACPNCGVATDTRTLAGNQVGEDVVVEACRTCRLLWLDRGASGRLAAASVIELFRYIGTAPRADGGAATTMQASDASNGQSRPADPGITAHAAPGVERVRPLASTFDCPRCSQPLKFTHDLQRTTRFTYWRCEWDGGRLSTFQQFLREKNFVRTPTPAEIARLRAMVQQVSCSQCGAPIDLADDSACLHCGAPIALVDSDGVTKALRALATPQPSKAANAAELAAALAAAQVMVASEWESQRRRDEADEASAHRGLDLMAAGVSLALDWLATRMAP